MAELRLFDIPGAVREGYKFGTEQRLQREGEQRQSALSQLASQAYGAQGPERQALVQQAIGVDPRSGFALGDNLQADEDRRNTSMVNMARMLTTAPEQLRPGLYASMVPTLQSFGLSELPPVYDASTAQVIDQAAQSIVQAYSGADDLKSLRLGADGFYYAIQGGQLVNTGVRGDPGMQSQTITVTGADGRPRQVTFNKRTGTYEEPQFGVAPQPSAQQPQGWQRTSPIEYVAADGQPIPPADQQALAAAVAEAERTGGEVNVPASRPAPAVGGGPLPPRLDYQNGGTANPFVGRSPEEQAALTTAAQERVKLGFLPEQGRIEADNAGLREQAVQAAQLEAERREQAPKRIARYEQALATARNVETSIGKAEDLIGPMSTGFMGARLRGIEGSPAYNLAAEIETIKANLGFDRLQEMRDNSPTGGALGQVAIQELVALQSTVANLDPDQSDEQLLANLQRIRQHYSRWKAAVEQSLAEERGRGNAPSEAQQANGWSIQVVP